MSGAGAELDEVFAKPGCQHRQHSSTNDLTHQGCVHATKEENMSEKQVSVVTLWGRRVRCHELDRHIYLDERFLDLTPIEYGVFWLLLRQTLQALGGAPPAGGGCTTLDRYLQQVGIVPTERLLQIMTGDVGSLIASWPEWRSDRRGEARLPLAGADMNSRSRACLTSHLDRLRNKLRCHGLDVGTILLSGRSAQGYMLFPVDDIYGIDR
jgi:hypothetical protein